MKTKGAQVHFLIDVLVAVASFDLKVPIVTVKQSSVVSQNVSSPVVLS